MDSGSIMQSGLAATLGVWVGLVLTLMVLSQIVGDNILARLAQYLLVGATLGYLAHWAAVDILWRRLLFPLVRAPGEEPWLVLPFILVLLLIVTSAAQMRWSARKEPSAVWHRTVRFMGQIPLGLLLGVGIAVGITGAIQGTLLPQFWRAASMGLPQSAAGGVLVSGLLTLVVTTGAILHLYASPDRATPSTLNSSVTKPFSYGLTRLWAGIGKRALWLAAGAIFARLLASRFSLFVARVNYLRNALETTGLWTAAEALWQSLTR